MRPEILRITEIFYSLQGESRTVGLPTVFVRLTGCPLRCSYCDTAYAFHGGELVAIEQIVDQVQQYQTPYVTVTGGEPLAQKNCLLLLQQLCDQGLSVSLETSGALPIAQVDPRVCIVMDIKTPGSAELDRNCWENLTQLKRTDQIKFVLCDRQDYEWSKAVIAQHNMVSLVDDVLMSVSADQLNPAMLADWILEDRLSVRFQLQLHKILWQDARGR